MDCNGKERDLCGDVSKNENGFSRPMPESYEEVCLPGNSVLIVIREFVEEDNRKNRECEEKSDNLDRGRNRALLEIKRGNDRKPPIAECNAQFSDPPAHPAHGVGRVEESPRYSKHAEGNRQRSATIGKSQHEPDEEGQQETCDRCCNDLLSFHLPFRNHTGTSREPGLPPFPCDPIFNDIPVFT